MPLVENSMKLRIRLVDVHSHPGDVEDVLTGFDVGLAIVCCNI